MLARQGSRVSRTGVATHGAMWMVDKAQDLASIDRGGSEVNGGEIAGRLVEANEEGDLAVDAHFFVFFLCSS